MNLHDKKIHGLTPIAIVHELDKYVIGQVDAKRAVANAIRNRMRRLVVSEEMKAEISPKNILMVGSTGIGKTEIARRLASLTDSPFVKVEATKFTEVGYVGRDVESIIRDLLEDSLNKVRNKSYDECAEHALERALKRVADVLLLLDEYKDSSVPELLSKIKNGDFDNIEIEIDVQQSLGYEIVVPHGMEELSQQFQNIIQSLNGDKASKRLMTVKKALDVLREEESGKLINEEELRVKAINLAEEQGIVFIDEIDKVVRSNNSHGDVSREGVQRDLLPLLDGTTINTKYGSVRTDYILFIASGAFMNSEPGDMLSELQGRLPIRVNLHSLTKEDFVRILQEPKNSLVKQYQSLLDTEGVKLIFSDEAINKIAEIACILNSKQENIGARRLQTVMEQLLNTISFDADRFSGQEILIDSQYVEENVSIDSLKEDSDWIL